MTLGQEVALLKHQIETLKLKILDMAKNLEDKDKKPYSKVGLDRLQGNKDTVFDGKTGIWKTYSVYKDEPEEE